MSRRLSIAAGFALGLIAAPAGAHPHIFVETGLVLLHDDAGRLTGLRVTWTYDELFSLLLLEDLGLDDDYDSVLTEAESEALQGFDMDWPVGYEGDVYVTIDDALVALAPPEAVPGSAALGQDGRLVSSHIRPLATPVDPNADSVVIRVYDPSFYTAYEISVGDVMTEAVACRTEVFTPDLDTAYAQLESALEELMAQGDNDMEMDFPPVGDRFAEEVRLTCDGGS